MAVSQKSDHHSDHTVPLYGVTQSWRDAVLGSRLFDKIVSTQFLSTILTGMGDEQRISKAEK